MINGPRTWLSKIFEKVLEFCLSRGRVPLSINKTQTLKAPNNLVSLTITDFVYSSVSHFRVPSFSTSLTFLSSSSTVIFSPYNFSIILHHYHFPPPFFFYILFLHFLAAHKRSGWGFKWHEFYLYLFFYCKTL